MIRTQVWLQGQSWVRLKHGRRVLTWLTQPVPRMDTLYVVRAAMEHFGPTDQPASASSREYNAANVRAV